MSNVNFMPATPAPPTTRAEYLKAVAALEANRPQGGLTGSSTALNAEIDAKLNALAKSIPYDPQKPWEKALITGNFFEQGRVAPTPGDPLGINTPWKPFYVTSDKPNGDAGLAYLQANIGSLRDVNGNPVTSVARDTRYYMPSALVERAPRQTKEAGGLFGAINNTLEKLGPLLPLAIAAPGILGAGGFGGGAAAGTGAATGATGATGLGSLGSSVLPAAEAFGAGVSPGLLAPGVADMGAGLGAGAVGAGTIGSGGLLSGVGDFLKAPIGSISNLLSGGSPGGAMSTAQLNEAANIYKAAGYTDAEIAGFLSQASGASLADVGAALNGTSSALNFANGAAGTGLFGSGISGGQLLSGGLSLAGGLLSGNAAANAARTSADAQIRAAQIAADAAKFKPVGVSTNFGSSRFGYDQNGNLINAGYSLSPQLQAQQNTLMGASNPLLSQFTGSQAATAPMGQAAQSLFGLGNQYLQTTPEQQAAKFMQEQQALLAAPRANQLADIQARLNAQGRGGLSIGGNAGQMAANPELAAYYNALQQQDLGLAANATQGGMDYAKFGGGLVGLGGDMLNSMYGVQSNAYQPYATALGGAAKIEGLGQQALDTGINIGAKGTASNALSGQLMMNGLNNAATTMQDVNKISPWGTMLTSAGGMLNNYTNPQQQRFDPYTGQPVTQFGR